MTLLALLIMAGCGSEDGPRKVVLPTAVPITLTPRSTPLPPVVSAPRVGEGSRQIELRLTLFGDNVPGDARDAANDLEGEFEDALELDINVTFTNETDALEALCSGAPRAAWVSAYTYVKAQQECDAVPVLAVQRGRTPRIVVGETAEIVSRAVIDDFDQLQGLTFCRSADQDYFTAWVYPRLVLPANGIDPTTDLRAVQEYPTLMAMGRALYATDCNVIVLPPGEFDDFIDDLADELNTDSNPISTAILEDVIHVLQSAGEVIFDSDDLDETEDGDPFYPFDDGVIPFEVLVFAPDSVLPEALRAEITDVVEDFLTDRTEGDERLDNLLEATGVMPVTEESYASFGALIRNAGWDMTAAD
jgi:hypothetical protein